MTAPGAVILDVDGTLVRGSKLVPGAAAAVEAIRGAGLELLLVSNNPTKRRAHYVERLGAHGIAIGADEVVTAATVTAEYLAAEHADDELFVIGSPALIDLLEERELSVGATHERADAVVASFDRSFDYDALTEALWALEDDDVALLGTDPDVTIPTEDREIPGSGAIIDAIAGVAGRVPDRILGKPSETAIEAALSRLSVPAERCLIVGDRLDTDLAMGAAAGMTTALVLSGVTAREDVAASSVDPDYILDSVRDIERAL